MVPFLRQRKGDSPVLEESRQEIWRYEIYLRQAQSSRGTLE